MGFGLFYQTNVSKLSLIQSQIPSFERSMKADI